MNNDDIILVAEKRPIEKFKYKIWPGDEKDSNYEENNFYISNKPSEAINLEPTDQENDLNKTQKRKRDEEEPVDRSAKRESRSMKNRYFSVQNVKKVGEEDSKNGNTTESDQFLKRKDYLIKRLLRNRTLPGTEDVENVDDSKDDKQPNIIDVKATEKVRTPEFQAEFIPLFKTGSEDNKESDIDNLGQELSSYYGPYPYKCMKKVTQTIIESFKPIIGATYTNRAAEIAKMKVKLPSKFDKDSRLWRRIKRDTIEIRQQLKDKLERYKRHEQLMNTRRKNKKIYFVELDENSDSSNCGGKEKKNKSKKKDKFENDDENSSDLVITLESSSDSDMDSKYTQFGKYSKKLKNENQNKKAKKNKNKSNSRKKQKEIAKSVNNNSRLENATSSDQELEMLRHQYRSLRNARNKAMNSIKKKVKDKSSKQMSLEIERKIMNDEITKVRRMIKRLVRKNKKEEKKSTPIQPKQVNSKDVNSDKKALTNKKKKKKIKTNK